MSSGFPPRKVLPESVKLSAEKGRSERLQRLRTTLEQRLENPTAAIDALMSEASEGETHPDLWEKLHAASIRDRRENEVAEAYTRCANGPRMKRLPPEAQAQVLMHAADFFQGVRGDVKTAETFLERVMTLVPGHPDAFARLEKVIEKRLDARALLELYANVAFEPPRAASVLATQAYNRVLQLGGKAEVLSDEGCKKLMALVPEYPKLLDALEAHCRASKRAPLACALIEEALLDPNAPEELTLTRRHRLIDIYLGDAKAPASAIGHVELLLERDANDANAFRAAEKLLASREVASRAAAALQAARRARSG